MRGYVQVYTGNGKGKTTAALGLAIRAAGAGIPVFIAQFMKSGDYSEIKALSRFGDLITVRQFGLGRFVRGNPSPEDLAAAAEGLRQVREVLTARKHGVVILDEANVAVKCGVLPETEILGLLDSRPEDVELVLTGRGATEAVLDRADLVTEMREVKHYFQKGVHARVGIEK